MTRSWEQTFVALAQSAAIAVDALPARAFATLLCLVAPLASLGAEEHEFFERKIRPVLAEHCHECHSTSTKQKGGLALDSAAGWLRGGDSGPALIPGAPEESLILKAIRYQDEDLQMPPKTGPLSPQVIADFESWIRNGAPAPAPTTPQAPPNNLAIEAARKEWPYAPRAHHEPPAVAATAWPQSGLDHFILAKLEAQNLSPSKPAEKRALLRRATLDLTGLPPTSEEIRNFLEDTSPQSFARVIERLLASPAYGERWARHWLDVVRYTDSFDSRGLGGEADVPEAYRYRDWVVKAFNDDLPYDEFIRQQIAGDILASKADGSFDTNALIATGMYVLGEWGLGDADKEKMLTDIVDDQIDVTGRAFLGLTLACARCHDHKFDPISTRDYYAMAGIFFSSHILPNPGVKTGGSPTKRVPLASPAQIQEREAKLHRAEDLAKERDLLLDTFIKAQIPVILANFTAVAAPSSDNPPELAATEIVAALHERLGAVGGPLLSRKLEKVAGHDSVYSWRLPEGADTPSATVNTSGSAIAIGTLTLPPRSVSVHPSPSRGVTIRWRATEVRKLRVRAAMQDSDDKCGDGVTWSIRHGRPGEAPALLHTNSIPNGGKDAVAGITFTAETQDYLEITIYPRSAYECDTSTLNVTLEAQETGLSWDLAKDVLGANPENPLALPSRAEWSFREEAQAAPGLENSLIGKFARANGAEERGAAAEEISAQFSHFQKSGQTNDSPEYQLYANLINPRSPLWSRVRIPSEKWQSGPLRPVWEVEQKRRALRESAATPFPVTHALQEGGTAESAHAGFKDAQVHIRGRYDRLGETVPRAFPAVLATEQPRIAEGSGRLELARWIAGPENPLTARVMVNRIWQHHFGEGLVRTPNNFGKLGAPPTHPELLDYLADQFVASGWSIKAMHRQILLSAAYQQSSKASPETLAADPENLLFSRMSRRRLESEAIRDSLLAASGRLQTSSGGPASRELGNPRRTLYLMTIRSDRATYQTLFDAADASAIVEKRSESTVAPQALFLLNHPLVKETSAHLAALGAATSTDPRARVEWLYERLYARRPNEREAQIALNATHENTPEAWQAYCHALLCANEFVYID